MGTMLAGSTDNLAALDGFPSSLASPPRQGMMHASSAGDLTLPSLPRNFSHTALSGLEHIFNDHEAPHQGHGLFDNLDLGPLSQA